MPNHNSCVRSLMYWGEKCHIRNSRKNICKRDHDEEFLTYECYSDTRVPQQDLLVLHILENTSNINHNNISQVKDEENNKCASTIFFYLQFHITFEVTSNGSLKLEKQHQKVKEKVIKCNAVHIVVQEKAREGKIMYMTFTFLDVLRSYGRSKRENSDLFSHPPNAHT